MRADGEREYLRAAYAVGAVAAGAGLEFFAYALAVDAEGAVGWAAALVLLGGAAACFAYRRLRRR